MLDTRLTSTLAFACALTVAALATGCNRADKPAAAAAASAPTEAPLPSPGKFLASVCVNGQCGVLDQTGAIVVPFDNDYDAFAPFMFERHVVASKNSQWFLVSADAKDAPRAISTDIFDVAEHHFGFSRDGKVGLLDSSGQEVQAPRFESLYPGGEKQYIVYEVNGKQGILSSQGKLLTEAVYNDMTVRGDQTLVTAQRDGEHWVVVLKDGTQKKVDYDNLSSSPEDGHFVASRDGKHGLANAAGDLVVPLTYSWLGTPGGGRVAFKEQDGSLCGYLDYTGKVVIEPRFSECEPFGKKGAFAKAPPQPAAAASASASGEPAKEKFGFIGLDGTWLVPPTYDHAGPAGRTLLGNLRHVAGQAHVGRLEGLLNYKMGLFDLDQGKETVAPQYANLGYLAPNLYVFSDSTSPTVSLNLLSQESPVAAVGLMDGSGKVLLKPEQFVNIERHASGRYLVARTGDIVPYVALHGLDGKQLIEPRWHDLVIDEARAVVLGYWVGGTGDNAERALRAVYDLRGQPIFTVKRSECGVDQLMNASGKPIWPLEGCPKKT